MSGNKGFVTMLEMVIVIIILFVSFSILLPGFNYSSKWSDNLLLLKNRDVLVAADRIGQLHNYSFNSTKMQEFLDASLKGETGIISWSDTEGTFKSNIWVACNCTNDELNSLTSWFRGLKINDREIELTPCYTNLEKVNPCLSSSDVLLIFGKNDLSNPSYLKILENYMKTGSGIVEVSDLNPNSLDRTQNTIFGIGPGSGQPGTQSDYDQFRDAVASSYGRPESAASISYQPWKYFYHIPVPLSAGTLPSGSPPVDSNLAAAQCNQLSVGNFLIQSSMKNVGGELLEMPNDYRFWICNSNNVYFDTDLSGKADTLVSSGGSFKIRNYYGSGTWDFTLNYIDGQKSIGVSFNSNYNFADFATFWPNECQCPEGTLGKCNDNNGNGLCAEGRKWAGEETNLLSPLEGNLPQLDRILIQTSQSMGGGGPIPAVILNSSQGYKAAWMANFTEGDKYMQMSTGDDERLLLMSLILWASDKRSYSTMESELKLGSKASYVNEVNKDMFEVYDFNFGLGYPF